MKYINKQIFKKEVFEMLLVTTLCSIAFIMGDKFHADKSATTQIFLGASMGVFAVIILHFRDRIFKTRQSWEKGLRGEEFLKKKLLDHLPQETYLCTNVQLNYGDADLLLINGSGIYCIECKNYSGYIFYDTKKEQLFHNNYPLNDNYLKLVRGRSREIQNIIKEKLGINVSYVQSVLVFSSKGVKLDCPWDIDNTFVCYPNKLIDHLKKNQSEKISKEDQGKIYNHFSK